MRLLKIAVRYLAAYAMVFILVYLTETHRKGLTNRRETEADILLPILLPRRLAIYEKFAYKPVAMKFLEVAT